MAIAQYDISIEYTEAPNGYWVRYDDHLDTIGPYYEIVEALAAETCEFGAGQPTDCGECLSCKARKLWGTRR
jgi:hypothetical protein